MASQYDGDDDGSLIDDETIDEFYDRFNNEVDESLAEEEESIVKSSSPLVFTKTSSLRYYPIFNRADKVLRYHQSQLQHRHQQQQQKQELVNQQPLYRSSISSLVSPVGRVGSSTGVILNNRLRSIPTKTKKFSNSGSRIYQRTTGVSSGITRGGGRHFEYILPVQRYRKLEATINDKKNFQFKTDTSISGFKNHTSTNYVQQPQDQSHPKDTKKRLFDTPHKPHQLHSHQIRSVIEGNSLQQQKATGPNEGIGSGRSGISFDRVEVSWFDPALPLTTIFAISIFGIVVLGIVIIFWLKNLLFHRNKTRKQDHTNCHVIRTEGQNFIKEKLQVMDDDPKSYRISEDHQTNVSDGKKRTDDAQQHVDSDVEVVDNRIVDELHSNFDSLTIDPTPKNDVLLVDKKSSPIVLEPEAETSCHRHFIFTSTAIAAAAAAVSTPSTLYSNIGTNSRSSGVISVAAVPIPVPVPIPLPIPIPVPIPVTHHQSIYQQQPYRTEKSYHQQQAQEKQSTPVRPLLLKSSSTTSQAGLSSPAQTNRSRRFSLCERRSHSPQTSSSNAHHHHTKAQSISRLSRRDHYDGDFGQTVANQPNRQQFDGTPTSAGIIQKCFDTHCSTDDKENEIPAGGDVYSPKMKLSEQVLAQQNSPRSFSDSPAATTSSSVMRFTFSPKQILANSENGSSNGNSPPVVAPPPPPTGAICQPSPLLNSAVYKHGNYFKFPEVDCLTPEKSITITPAAVSAATIPPLTPQQSAAPSVRRYNQDSLESHPSSEESGAALSSASSSPPAKMRPSPATLSTPPVTQATRRARLKSISLDSDGARLVEDNLGVPVEELIERANQSPTLTDDCFVFNDTTSNQTEGGNTKGDAGHQIIEDMTLREDVDTIDGGDSGNRKFSAKNRNQLTITIGTELVEDDLPASDDISGDSVKLIPNLPTPKTPTLTQTKQKAISLDSSDSSIIYCLPSSGNLGGTNQQGRASNSTKTSLLQISSISVPTTPKRQQLLLSGTSISGMGRKLQSNAGSKGRLLTTSKIGLSKSSASTPSTSFDHDNVLQKPQGFITKLRSFNENTIDDGFYDDENYDMDSEGDIVMSEKRATVSRSRELSIDFEDDPYGGVQGFAGSSTNLLGANLQNQKCTTSLSLSNNNLKTLPEVMTISDFSTDTEEPHHPDDEMKSIVKSMPSPGICSSAGPGGVIGVVQKTPRNSILQRRGSNHSLTLNLNGSLGNLTKSLSVSNYSLGSANLQASQCNLTASSHNLSHHQQQQQQQQQMSGASVSSTQIGVPQGYVGGPLSNTNVCGTGGSKKNLLQRRGSNTSLTLNIKGSSCMSLNRFNSHSSLNISSMQHQAHPHQPQHQQQLSQAHQLGGMGGGGGGGFTKKGLLERRNSNASLTLNIQNRALSISNCNLRGSACSLSSVNTNIMDYDGNLHAEHHHEQDPQQQYDMSYSTSAKHRKFLSSENLNSITQCSKLNQTHVRNSTKTCFGSVSDLKPHQLVQQKIQTPHTQKLDKDTTGIQPMGEQKQLITTFGESNLCSCTGVRNITTKPLSPQSTSEDFKMYLANIQLLQNATNVLDDEHLRKLSYIFDKSYNMPTIASSAQDDSKMEVGATTTTAATSAIEDTCMNDDIIDITINFEAPNDDEQKLLLRNLHQEFWDLPTNYQEKPLVFGSQAKNRYKTILPNEHSRVILDCEPGFAQEPYINANYIKGPDYAQNSYIATQGPMSNTIYEYWLMIYQNVAKFTNGRIIQTINKSNCEKEQNVEKIDIDDWSDCARVGTSSNITTILKTKTPTTETISIRNAFAPGISDSTRNSDNCNSRESNSGKFNQKIVMLTNFVENNRQKCSTYFPIDAGKVIIITNTNDKIDSGNLINFYEAYFNNTETEQFEDYSDAVTLREINVDVDLRTQVPMSNYFVIRNCSIIKKNGFSIRKLLCIYCSVIDSGRHQCRQFFCNHYWFPDWPDHRSPTDIDVLLDMSLHLLDGRCENEFYKIDNIDNEMQQGNVDNQPLPVIHCSAGIGRTGCLAAILNGLRQMRTSLMQLSTNMDGVKKNNINVDVLGIVCNLRLQRGGMVQNSEQYELIHRALCVYLKRLDLEKIGISVDAISEDETINKSNSPE